jgi:predicted TIM-barrel fold metal-dependent hydrolase
MTSMVRICDFPVFDGDNHLYETRDAFTRHLPSRYRDAIQYVELNGRTKIMIRGTVSDYIPNPTFDVVARPGAQEAYFRDGNPEGKSYRELIGEPMRAIPAFREPGPRLEVMDELGVDRSLMFPTLASLLEERMRDDPELTHAAIHSLNEWLYEEWSFNYQDRIFATPVITLPIVERAIQELEWVVERGAKVVLIRPAPVPGYRGSRSFALEEFDPFWKALVEADVLVGMHSSDSGYARYMSDWTGPTEMLPFRLDAFRMMYMGSAKRAAEDTCAAMTCHGLLSRFPDLRIAFIENGADWVIPFIEHLHDVHRKMPQMFEENPVEAFKRNVYVAPFHEDDIAEVASVLGMDHVIFGSDYPHPEGLAEPCSYLDHLPSTFSEEEKAKIMGGNLARIMRVDVPTPA